MLPYTKCIIFSKVSKPFSSDRFNVVEKLVRRKKGRRPLHSECLIGMKTLHSNVEFWPNSLFKFQQNWGISLAYFTPWSTPLTNCGDLPRNAMENTTFEQPAIMVEDAEINVGPNELDTKAVSPEYRDNDSKSVHISRNRREKRPRFSWSGWDSVGALHVMAAVACVIGLIALLLGSLGLSRSGDIFVNVTQGILASKTGTKAYYPRNVRYLIYLACQLT